MPIGIKISSFIFRIYLCKIKHAEIGVHGHGPRRLTNLLVDTSRISEFSLHCIDVSEKQLHVSITTSSPFLIHTCTHTVSKKNKLKQNF